MTNHRRNIRTEAGFTLIELLVVVLIIGILAAIAIPQYFKVVERARVSEAQSFISQVKQAQERYLAKNGVYATSNAALAGLDISFPGTSPAFGMKFFQATLGAGAGGGGCVAGDPRYNIAVSRRAANAGVAARYTATYTVLFERCTGALTYPGCANCTADFSQ
jgi:prepilin-type N-terminal cleavage/methylation domain-containing protein